MNYHPLVIPFLAGTVFLLTIITIKYFDWIRNLDSNQSLIIKKNIFTSQTIKAINEVFHESLLHRKIFRKNTLLGYMHMSLAFGWFLMIVIGKIESSFYYGTFFDSPWLGIFFKYFARTPHHYFMIIPFSFIMDLLLLVTLGGVFLALFKRIRSRSLGIKKTTSHILLDRIALMSLWWIFPLRLLAESTTAEITGNGSFLTGTVGHILAPLSVEHLELPLWWAYSICIGIFFFTLPYSRYMHIPTEVLLIFLRKWGAMTGEGYSGYTDIQLNSCSRCGICIDACQLNFAGGINNVQSVYFIRDTRYHKLAEEVANNCLLCGRCVEACPVGLELTVIRQQLRQKAEIQDKQYFGYSHLTKNTNKADIVYFAGCMTHLTPSISISMKKIFDEAGIRFWFMDDDNGLCCGRPLRQQGYLQQSKDLVTKNTQQIQSSGANMLVTSCPICYNSFKNEYALDIPVVHHSEYIEMLIKENKLELTKTQIEMVYHDPCELGRGCGVYEQPRHILNSIGNLTAVEFEKEASVCCGGSLSNIAIEPEIQQKIRKNALKTLTKSSPDLLVTACPLCKKTFVGNDKTKVMDIAEVVATNIKYKKIQNKSLNLQSQKK